MIAPPLVVTLKFPPSVIAGSASAAAPLVVVKFESVVPPPIAPPSVIVPLPALSVSAWLFAAVPSIVPLNEIALLVVASVVVDWSVVAPVKLCAPVVVTLFKLMVAAVTESVESVGSPAEIVAVSPPSLVIVSEFA